MTRGKSDAAAGAVVAKLKPDNDSEAVESEAVGDGEQPGLVQGEDDIESAATEPDRAEESNPPGMRGLLVRLRGRIRLPRRRKGRLTLAAVVLLLIGAGTGGYLWWNADGLPEGSAFRVGNRVVTADDLNVESDRLRVLFGVQPPADAAKLGDYRRSMAKAQAVQIVLTEQAKRSGIQVADKTAQDMLSGYIAQQVGEGREARDTFVENLETAGVHEPDVLAKVKEMLTVNELFSQRAQGIAVGDEELRQAFEQRRDSLGTPEKRAVKNVVVKSKEEADQLMAKLAGGAGFEETAKASSLDKATSESGGDLGELSASQLEDNYAAPAFATPQGGLFGPVQTQHGWNIGKVFSVVPAVPAQFDEARERLRQQLVQETATHRWNDWLTEQLRAADIEYADDFRPPDPDAAPPPIAGNQSGVAGGPTPGN